MSLTTADYLSGALFLAALTGMALYGSIVLASSGGRRNSRIEILISAGALLMLGLLSRTLDRSEELLYAGTAGVLLAGMIANQWRWHLRTRAVRP